jgi:hypothetical protein
MIFPKYFRNREIFSHVLKKLFDFTEAVFLSA